MNLHTEYQTGMCHSRGGIGIHTKPVPMRLSFIYLFHTAWEIKMAMNF